MVWMKFLLWRCLQMQLEGVRVVKRKFEKIKSGSLLRRSCARSSRWLECDGPCATR